MACVIKCHYDHKLKPEEKEGLERAETEVLIASELERAYKRFGLEKQDSLIPNEGMEPIKKMSYKFWQKISETTDRSTNKVGKQFAEIIM